VTVSIESRLGFPTGDSRSVIPIGSGDFRGELRLAVAKAWTQIPIYFDCEFGFTLRGSGLVTDRTSATGTAMTNYAPEVVLYAEVGAALLRWKGVNRILLAFSAGYRGSTVKEDPAAQLAFTPSPSNSENTAIGVVLTTYLMPWMGVYGRFTQSVEGLRLPKLTTGAAGIFFTY
jgi:hypothetical protein